MTSATTAGKTFDLSTAPVRELNEALHAATGGSWRVLAPAGRHSVAVGLDAPLQVEIDGHVGYYCAGMNQLAEVRVRGNSGLGVGENMMSGSVVVEGDASQAAGASAHGGRLVIEGNAAARCGISLKGADLVIRGSVGHMSAFMAQSGRMVVCGDAGEALGDSIYEARVYVRGNVGSLGADCTQKEMRDEHRRELVELLGQSGLADVDPADFKRYGSARELYNFNVDNAGAY